MSIEKKDEKNVSDSKNRVPGHLHKSGKKQMKASTFQYSKFGKSKSRNNSFGNKNQQKDSSKIPPPEEGVIRIIPLGGVEEIGKNMTAIEIGEDIIVIDAGMYFSTEETPGVDYVIPNTTYLEERKDRIRALFITHGHLDHIGGVPLVLSRIGNPPVYSRNLSILLMRKRQAEFPHLPAMKENIVEKDDTIMCGKVKVKFFGVTHTIPDSMGIIVDTPNGWIVTPGDYKLDQVEGKVSESEEKEYSIFDKNKVLLLMTDSTNIENEGFSLPEVKVHQGLENLLKKIPGRIIIAAFASHITRLAQAVVKAGLEVAYMAPTEILAKQHFESFIQYFGNLGIQVGLITGTECRKFPSKIFLAGRGAQHTHISRPQLLKWVANGEIPILVGTHALIQKAVKFKNLAYAIIDEQHRFGVKQRAALVRKDTKFAPHLLSMTATPIPRTLALTVYGDLDLTLLDEMPAGRRAIITKIIAERERASAYAAAERELAAGRQAYVICPRIDEPDPTKELALNTKSAKAEQKRLQEKVFPHHTVGLLHSKMTPIAKEEVMKDFTDGKIDILVATSVVEVGVNVPNATVIIIEGAERFGLAQLHQLRGRVLRSNHQAYCYLFTTSGKTESTRLQALEKAKNGFELAELDLKLRGAGALGSGPAGGGASKQWGLSDLGMEALQNLKMVEAARTEAQKILNTDPELKKYPLLREQIHQPQTEVHFE
jgi:superfamily II DNA or RNA helicase